MVAIGQRRGFMRRHGAAARMVICWRHERHFLSLVRLVIAKLGARAITLRRVMSTAAAGVVVGRTIAASARLAGVVVVVVIVGSRHRGAFRTCVSAAARSIWRGFLLERDGTARSAGIEGI